MSLIKGRLRNFLVLLIVISTLSLIGQLTFQIVLLSNPPYANENILPNCSFKSELLQEIGFSRLDTAYIYDIFRIIVPDFLMLIISISTLLMCQLLTRYNIKKKKQLLEEPAGHGNNLTAFADNFCPLANVQKEPATGRLTTQITTSQDYIDNIESINENDHRDG